MPVQELLERTADAASRFIDGVGERRVGATASLDELRAALGGEMPEHGEPADSVIDDLCRRVDPGLMAIAGPRYFGFVIGGSVPAATAADWLVSAWDQNLGLYAAGPALSVVEEVTAGWIVDLFGLPAGASVGFTTGTQMAHVTALAAARHRVLAGVGWDVDADGLFGAPPIDIVVGDEVHVTVPIALKYLGLGRDRVKRVASDGEGRMRVDALREVLATCTGPTIVCLQAGNVNTGSFDPFAEIVPLVRGSLPRAWIHVDGAFGMWAAASPELRHLMDGAERADSWSTDAHKWPNVPYDSGMAIVADAEAHRAAMTASAAYLVAGAGGARDGVDWVPEFSRRARGVPVYAALRSLGRDGLAALIEHDCAMARRFADALRGAAGIEILNEVVLNQALVRFDASDDRTRAVIAAVQEDGTCWLGGTTWHGLAAMRISVSNWSTTQADIDRSAAAVLRCHAAVRGD